MIGVAEAAVTKTTAGSAASVICAIQPATLSATVGMPELREIGIFNVTGAAAEIGLVWGTTAGVTPSGGMTVQNSQGGAGSTIIYPTYATYPTIATTYTRRAELQAVAGAGIIWTWLPGEWQMWSTSGYPFVVYQISAVNTVFDIYVKVAELWQLRGREPHAPDRRGAASAARVGTGAGLAGADPRSPAGQRRRADVYHRHHRVHALVHARVRRGRQPGPAARRETYVSESAPEYPPAGWLVTDPDGNVVAAGPQTMTNASADAGQEQ